MAHGSSVRTSRTLRDPHPLVARALAGFDRSRTYGSDAANDAPPAAHVSRGIAALRGLGACMRSTSQLLAMSGEGLSRVPCRGRLPLPLSFLQKHGLRNP
jgi:hypothetical protein